MININKKFVLSVILFFLLVGVLTGRPTIVGTPASRVWAAQITIKEKNGYDWEVHTHLFKLGYVEGYIAGVSRLMEFLTTYLAAVESHANKLANVEAESSRASVLLKLVDALNKTISECELYNITVGQMVSGLDEFYKDYRNKQIFATDAMYIVKMEIRGVSPNEIEEAKRVLRMTPVERQKYYEEKEKQKEEKEKLEKEKLEKEKQEKEKKEVK